MDGLLTRAAKLALRLPVSAPTALVQEDVERGGAGVTSLQEAYVAELTAKLTDSLNDRGRLGHVTWMLLKGQIQRVGAMNNSQLAERMRHSRLLRTVTLLAACGGTLMRYTAEGSPEWIALQGCDITQLIERLKQ